MEVTICGLTFTSKFNSGNLTRVEKVSAITDDNGKESTAQFSGTKVPLSTDDPKPDFEFNVWTKPDCAGTIHENRNRTWFYFGIRGGPSGKVIRINVMNLNRQGRLYSQGHVPIIKCPPLKPKWERLKDKPTYVNGEGNMILSFFYRFIDPKQTSTAYFAFSYPWSYTDCQERLAELDAKYHSCQTLNSKSAKNALYYKRELLCYTLDKERVDLITVSDCQGLTDLEEPRIDDRLFPHRDEPRCKWITGKKVFFVSSRVHPGETPGSFVFNGFLDFILREDDPRAAQLRRQYVFKLIPILNPDGVSRGHYRTDSRGVNLNRVYLDPSFDLHPSIYAAKTVLVFHHVNNRVRAGGNDGFPLSGFWLPTLEQRATVSDLQSTAVAKNVVPVATAQAKDEARLANISETSFVLTAPASDAVMSTSHREQNNCHDGGGSGQRDSCVSYNVASGGECEDVDDYSEECYDDSECAVNGIGNEGSDDEGDETPITEGVYSPHLIDPRLRNIAPNNSGIAVYVDLHAHASKRGCFIYGNYLEDDEQQAQNVLFARLISLNSPHFDFEACNFTERNMYSVDRKEGLSKEGSGRVALHKALGIIHCYTLECNYNTGRIVNLVPPACADMGRASPPPLAGVPPKYTPAHYEDVGRAVAVSGLDITDTNPWSRLTLSEYGSVQSLREILRRQIQSSRAIAARSSQSKPSRAVVKGASGVGAIPRVAILAVHRHNMAQQLPDTGGSGPGKTNVWQPGGIPSRITVAQPVRKLSLPGNRRELGPVKEASRGSQTLDRRHHVVHQSGTSVSAPPGGGVIVDCTAESTPLSPRFTFTQATDSRVSFYMNEDETGAGVRDRGALPKLNALQSSTIVHSHSADFMVDCRRASTAATIDPSLAVSTHDLVTSARRRDGAPPSVTRCKSLTEGLSNSDQKVQNAAPVFKKSKSLAVGGRTGFSPQFASQNSATVNSPPNFVVPSVPNWPLADQLGASSFHTTGTLVEPDVAHKGNYDTTNARIVCTTLKTPTPPSLGAAAHQRLLKLIPVTGTTDENVATQVKSTTNVDSLAKKKSTLTVAGPVAQTRLHKQTKGSNKPYAEQTSLAANGIACGSSAALRDDVNIASRVAIGTAEIQPPPSSAGSEPAQKGVLSSRLVKANLMKGVRPNKVVTKQLGSAGKPSSAANGSSSQLTASVTVSSSFVNKRATHPEEKHRSEESTKKVPGPPSEEPLIAAGKTSTSRLQRSDAAKGVKSRSRRRVPTVSKNKLGKPLVVVGEMNVCKDAVASQSKDSTFWVPL